MNCKPGDLAVIVRTLPAGEFLLGMPVTVLAAAPEPGWWVVKLPHLVCNPLNLQVGDEGAAPDDSLRPIRDPGDDARDETLDWLPVPVQEHAHV